MVYFSFFCWVISGWTGDWFVYFPQSPALDDKYARIINATIAYAKQKGFPEFVVFPGDEPGGHPDTLPDIRHYLQVIKQKCPGAKTGMTVGGGMSMGIDELGQLGPHCDIFDTNFLNPELLRKINRSGSSQLWVCNVGSMTSQAPRLDRYGFGFFAWKAGVHGMAQWVYRAGNPYEQAYYASGYGYVLPSVNNKPLPTIHWEAMRQGIIDQRYGATLTKLIQLAEHQGDAKARQAAAHATAVVKDVLGKFRIDYMNRRFPHSIRREFAIHSIDGAYFDTCRWRIAREILTLQQVLGDKAILRPDDAVFPMAPEETMFN